MWSRFLIPAAAAVLVGCAPSKPTARVAVTIAPLAWAVEGLTGVEPLVVVPPGTSPESYEPTARQIEELHRVEHTFGIGLIDFEQVLADRGVRFVRLADSLELIGGGCSHAEHSHGIDPHVWLSPAQMRRMVGLMADAIGSDTYARRDSLYAVIDSLDARIRRNLTDVRDVAVVHPSLGYFAKEYGLEQHSVEVDGKEPSGVRVRALIDTLRARGVRTVFYSIQDPDRAARVVAAEIGGSLTPFDPVARAWDQNLHQLSEHLCR